VKLAEYLAAWTGFDWGRSNCCHFAARWLVANGKPDPMAGLRSTPTLRDARRLVAELGGIKAACTLALGRGPIAAAFAQVGDIVHFEVGDGFTLGICNGRTSVCVDAEGAFIWVPTIEGTCAWRLA
jgi:hypothetical protein